MDPSAWPQLAAFLAVAEHTSFTRAARALGVSPSALSQSVRSLEAKIGTTLLSRTTRTVAVTEAGEQLARAAGPAVKQLHEALVAAATPSGELTGTLRLSLPGLAAGPVIGPMVARFAKQHPRVHVELVVDNRLVNIVEERFDAGVRLVEAVQRDMVTVRLTESFRFVVVGSPDYLREAGVPKHPRDLGSHTLIGFRSPTTGAIVPWDLERRSRVWKVPTSGPVTANSEGVLLDLAVQGLGLAYVSELSAERALRARKLSVVLEEWCPEVPGFFLYFPSRAQASKNLKAFIACAPSRLRPSRARPTD